jgi:dTDP-3-amino-3,4,6-trideoxy-alpha-D-glucose transaminase
MARTGNSLVEMEESSTIPARAPGRQAATKEVPFLDLGRIHAGLKDVLLDDVAALIDSGSFINGPAVAEFEAAFASYCGSRYAVAVASGTDALRLGLLASGVRAGDEVIVPALTFVATLEAVTQAGARPVVVDVLEDDATIDPAGVEAVIGARTSAVIPVHLYGRLADMRRLDEVTRAHSPRIQIHEDACQAHGAVGEGIRPGELARSAAYSFYPGKNLGAFGDAGAITTNDEGLADRVTALREHGQRAKYVHEVEGWTARLDSIQALVLLRKLPLLDAWNEERRAIAARYLDELDGVGDLTLPVVAPGQEPVWHLFVVQTAYHEQLSRALAARGVQTARHYPDAVHLTPAYRWLGYSAGDFPVAERRAAESLSLPIFPGMTGEEIELVIAAVRAYFGHDG